MPETRHEKDDSSTTHYSRSMEELIAEHSAGLVFAAEITRIAEEGQDHELVAGIEKVRKYNEEDLESHLQHEEQTILGPLIQSHPEHTELCVTIGKEHGYIRSLIEEMSVATARKDLADFGLILKNHTLLENEELFPIVEKLFTEEQMDAIASFVPLRRKQISSTQSQTSSQQDSTDRQEWLLDFEAFYNRSGQQGGSIVLFPRFNPELFTIMAQRTGLELFNYQQEVMDTFGQDADRISLNQLDESLRSRAEQSGIIAHNIEALLCVKSEQERREWLRSFLDGDWPNPVLLPICIYQTDVPIENDKVCDLELHKMPGLVEETISASNNRSKYHLEKRNSE